MAGTDSFEARQEALIETLLRRICILDDSSAPRLSWSAFRDLRTKIGDGFAVDWTTLSLSMCRLLFALACCRQPRSVVVLGSHVGFAAAWLLRDRQDPRCGEAIEDFAGIDPDRAANRIARANCAVLNHAHRVKIHDSTGQHYLSSLQRPIDLILIDIDDPVTRKAAYVDLLDLAMPHLSPGAFVLAHDTMVPRFADDIDAYHERIDRHPGLEGPWLLPVDDCGLTVARRAD